VRNRTQTVFLDCETLPALEWTDGDKARAARKAVPGTYSKPESIEKWIAENADDVWRRTALDPTRGRILAIGLAVDDGDVVIEYNEGGSLAGERKLLEWLLPHIGGDVSSTWVAHNGQSFDFRWLKRRSAKHGLYDLSKAFHVNKPWESHLVDTLAVWNAPDRPQGGTGSMDSLCEFFGISRADNPISGAEVFDRWAAGDHEAIKAHLVDDVARLRDVYRIMQRCGWCS
jgi:hypothetical protein